LPAIMVGGSTHTTHVRVPTDLVANGVKITTMHYYRE
jgi:hypothetical protein